jgi:DNA invertase Pin-like site-specific DNA recombinase
MRAAIYARVSTVGHGQSVELQLRDLRQLAKQRGLEISREYCDEGVSGAKSSRPALDLLIADARRGKFRTLLVWKLDRLGRSLAHLVRLLDDFRACGVELVSFSEGLDFSTSTGKLMFQIVSAFSEFERDCIRERVVAGLRNAKAKGVRLGRPPVAVDATRIASLRARGASLREIAGQLGVGLGTIARSLQPRTKNLPKSASASR